MMHRAWSSIVEVPYCFSRSYVKFQGRTALKFVEFDPNWAFPDSNSSLNSPMAMKCCTKLETAKERCPIVFQGHPSNFKVTRDKTSLILTQIGRFQTIGRSQLSNPSDLPCFQMSTADSGMLWSQGCGIWWKILLDIGITNNFYWQIFLSILYSVLRTLLRNHFFWLMWLFLLALKRYIVSRVSMSHFRIAQHHRFKFSAPP